MLDDPNDLATLREQDQIALIYTRSDGAPANGSPVWVTPTKAATGGKGFEKTDCWFKEPTGRDVECGWLTVPEDHAQPDGKTIKLAVARFKSDASKPQPDPIVYLEGGPGGSPLKSSILSQFDVYYGPLLDKRDLILFDQRGTGYSQPALDCPESAGRVLEIGGHVHILEVPLDVAEEAVADGLVRPGAGTALVRAGSGAARGAQPADEGEHQLEAGRAAG